ncbi:MAG: response regulator [Planktomarina sp.]
MSELDDFLYTQPPSAARPLLGITILLIEDSLTACEAMRLMCIRSGARLRRADCLESARRHLGVYMPTILITDMGLPDGSGADLIAELKAKNAKIDTILALSADPDQKHAAMDAGADGFMHKPIGSIAEFQTEILQYLPADKRPNGPRRVCTEAIKADDVALQEDLAHALNLLEDGEDTPATHRYLANFLAGVASTASDAELADLAAAFGAAKAGAASKGGVDHSKLSAGLTDRLAKRMAI